MIDNLSNLCFSLETDYTADTEIQQILQGGETIDTLIHASAAVRAKEESSVLKFPIGMDLTWGEQHSTIEELPLIVDMLCDSTRHEVILACINALENKDVCLKVSGAFSRLCSAVDMHVLFRWMRRYETTILQALVRINNCIAAYIIEALQMGAKIISYAEPCASPQMLGEPKYKKFVADLTVTLMQNLEGHLHGSIMHLCPRSSVPLERYGYITSHACTTCVPHYTQTLLTLAQSNTAKFTGHQCINAEYPNVKKAYVLTLKKDNVYEAHEFCGDMTAINIYR